MTSFAVTCAQELEDEEMAQRKAADQLKADIDGFKVSPVGTALVLPA